MIMQKFVLILHSCMKYHFSKWTVHELCTHLGEDEASSTFPKLRHCRNPLILGTKYSRVDNAWIVGNNQ